jgi:hypothetical protein
MIWPRLEVGPQNEPDAERARPDRAAFDRRHPLETREVGITTFVPLQFKRRGIRKVLVGPAGVDEPSRSATRTQRFHRIRMRPSRAGWGVVSTGSASWIRELWRTRPRSPERLHKTFVNDHLRLAILAPHLVGAALLGALPRTVTLLGLLRDGIPVCWDRRSGRASSAEFPRRIASVPRFTIQTASGKSAPLRDGDIIQTAVQAICAARRDCRRRSAPPRRSG